MIKNFYAKKSVVLQIVIINIAVFIIQNLSSAFENKFILVGAEAFSRPYILLTHMFMHGSLMHILFNMYALYIFGQLLENKIGSKRFLYLYLGAGIFAGAIASFFYPLSLGASGAIMGVLAALMVLMPDLRVAFFFAFPMKLWQAGIVWAIMDAVGIFFPSGVGNIAHLAGMGVGLAFGFYLKYKRKNFRKRFTGGASHMTQEDMDDFISRGRI